MALYTDKLGHSLEKFAAVTVFDATFYGPAGEPLITFDTLTVSNISTEASQKEIRGGQGANLLLSYDYGRTAEVEITDALASMYSLQYLWGGKLNNSGVIKASMTRNGVIGDDRFITGVGSTAKINEKMMTLVEGSSIYGLIKYEDEIEEDFGKKSKSEFEALIKTLPRGASYRIYTEETFKQGTAEGVTHSHVNELTLTATDFPPVMRLVGSTFTVDAKTGRKIETQIEIPRFKPSASFTFTFEAEGEASVFDFTGTALADGNRILVYRTLGYVDAVHGATDSTDVRDDVGKNPEAGNTNTVKPTPPTGGGE